MEHSLTAVDDEYLLKTCKTDTEYIEKSEQLRQQRIKATLNPQEQLRYDEVLQERKQLEPYMGTVCKLLKTDDFEMLLKIYNELLDLQAADENFPCKIIEAVKLKIDRIRLKKLPPLHEYYGPSVYHDLRNQ